MFLYVNEADSLNIWKWKWNARIQLWMRWLGPRVPVYHDHVVHGLVTLSDCYLQRTLCSPWCTMGTMTYSIIRRTKPLVMEHDMSGNRIDSRNRIAPIKVRLHPCLRERVDRWRNREYRNLTQAINILVERALDAEDARDALINSKDAS